MKLSKLFIAIISTASLFQSCSNYTDIKTGGALTPGEYENYRYLMNNMGVLERSIDMPDMTSDDIEYLDTTMQTSLALSFRNAYTWSENFYDATSEDPDWALLYASNYYCNLVIKDVMSSTDGTLEEKEGLIAEARVHRAYNYFTLVNEYGRQYNEATAATDLGVPLILEPNVSITPVRATVKAAYDLVLADLKSAIADLPAKPRYNIYPSKAAAYALLARVYLQMGNYTPAGLYADSALSIQNTLLDLPTVTTMPLRLDNPEIILSKKAGQSHAYSAYQVLSSDLLSLFDTNDFRYSKLTRDLTTNGKTFRVNNMESLNYENRNIGPSVPEMMLVAAECKARNNEVVAAMEILNTLRAKRFNPGDLILLNASNADEALEIVIEERRRELMFKCARWFDQKRLFNDSRFAKNISRTNLVTGQTAVLEPGSNRYLFPVPLYNIQLNPSLEQNPR